MLTFVVTLMAPSPACVIRDMSWMKMDSSALVSIMSKTLTVVESYYHRVGRLYM